VRFHVDGLEVPQPHHQSEHVLDIIPKCGDEPCGPWITTYIAPFCTASATGLFFILQRRRVAWGATRLVPLLAMFGVIENRQSCKYSKITAASVQNGQINSKKWSFALLLLTNPLYYTIINNIAMGLVAIGGPLSLTLGQQRVIIMVISMILDFGLWMPNFEFSKSKVGRFLIHHGKAIFPVATDPSYLFPSFQSSSSIRVHQGRLSRKRIIEKEPDLMEK
jgi:hypothetical protein